MKKFLVSLEDCKSVEEVQQRAKVMLDISRAFHDNDKMLAGAKQKHDALLASANVHLANAEERYVAVKERLTQEVLDLGPAACEIFGIKAKATPKAKPEAESDDE